MMFKLKRGFYLGLGIFTQLFVCYVFKLILFSLLNDMNKDTSQLTGIIIGSLIGILCVVVIQLILFGFSYWHREEDSHIFYYFFLALKKIKIVHHEHLGDFILKINEEGNDITLFEQNWFGLKRLDCFNITDDTEVLAKSIKNRLDSLYSQKLYEDDSKSRFNQKVNKIMDWDGHLDIVTRRDDKLDKLGIK